MIRRAAIVAAALLGASSSAVAQNAARWRSVDVARQLRDSLPQRIHVQYGAGTIDVRPTDDRVLYAMHLRYDESTGAPLHRYDAEQRSVVLGVESRRAGLRAAASGNHDDSGELRLALPRTVPLDLSFELGGTESSLELGDLALESLRLECGATDATLRFSTPTRARMRDIEIDVGAADFSAIRLANANADQLHLRGGVGVIDLDFGGRWTRDMTVSTRLTVGKLVLRVPADVGLRLEVERVATGFDHEGLVKRDDGWYSENWDSAAHHLRVRAETYFGKIEVQRGTR